MTKKHFEAAARLVCGYREPVLRDVLTDVLVDLFRQFNGRFDVERFRAACRGGVRS
jgi:hypothetical protein